MRKCFTFGIAIMLFIYSSPCDGNQRIFTFDQISLEQGLPGASVHCIYQDHKGLMWFAIESVGLCKYDGKNFTVYEHLETDSNTISNGFPLCIVEDQTGNLWVGTKEGLNEFDREKGVFKRYLYSSDFENCIPNNYITDLHVDKYNNIWIATRKGISKYVKSQNKFYTVLSGESEDAYGKAAMVSTLYEDKKGNIWIGSYSDGLLLIDHETNEKHTEDSRNKLTISKHWLPFDKKETHRDPNYAVQKICEYDENNLLLGKIDGLYLFNHRTEVFSRYNIHVNLSINYSTVSVLRKDKTGMIWVGYATVGLLLINPVGNDQYYFDANNYLPNGLRSNTIRDVYEDKSGLIWIATKFQGIHTYNKKQEIFNKHKYNAFLNEKIHDKFVLSILEDSKNNIWIGTKNDGIYKFNPVNGDVRNYTSKNSDAKYCINNNRVECVAEDAFGNIWAGTGDGINKLDKKGFKFTCYNDFFIRCMVADKHGNIWIGTNSSGLFYYDAKHDEIDRYTSSKENVFFNDNTFRTRAISITCDSLLWISSFQKGLYKYNIPKDILTHYLNDPEDSTSINGNMVRGVFEDNTGKIWIGTKFDGLNTYNSKTGNFTQVEKIKELPPGTIYNIVQDKNNNYWMGSHEGLFMINQKTGAYSLYTAIYGLKNSIFEVNAACKTRDGLMIFGGSEGLNVFDPDDVYKIEYIAPVIISSVKVYDKVIAEDINEYSELSINYTEKYISIGFALTDYSDPLKIKYKYKLENFDEEWIDSKNRNYATYTALPPGEYLFKVLAANPEDVWIDQPLTIKITVTGPFWRKPYFIAGCIVLLIVIAIIIYIARLRFIRQNEKKLRELVEIKTRDLMDVNQKLEEAKEKAEESDKLKSAFLANISHEIRTPMNGIIGFADLLEESKLTGRQEKQCIQVIQKSSKRMLRIINDLIDISKIEAGQISIFKEEIYINTIIDDLYAFFKPDAEAKGLTLIRKKGLPHKESVIQADRARIAQVLSNLISNAIKFTNAGQVTFGYTKKDATFEFYVSDTGVGIASEIINTIFERFRQANDPFIEFSEGSGLGLSISKAFVEIHGGEIWVESKQGKGSTFYFTLPCTDHIKKELEPNHKKKIIKPYSLKGKKILVVEDDEVSFLFFMNVLQKKGMNVFQAKNGIEAVSMVDSNTDIDIILMDMRLPGMNGLEATKRIKKKHSHIPIIMQTAFAQTHDRQKFLLAGCVDFITKPIQKELLLELICKYIVE